MSDVLLCPVCKSDVPTRASMCLKCHLPMKDVLAHQPKPTSWAAHLRRVRSAITATLVYAAIVAWCSWKLPDTLPFVVPGAALGVFLHALKGRPWLGALGASVIVIVLPAVFWPSMITGAFSDLANRRF